MWQFSSDLPASTSRPDGREPDKYRDILINWGSIDTANGSAIVKFGNTTVVSGITFEQNEIELSDDRTIEQIEEDTLSDLSNLVEISVRFQPHCSFSFKMQGNDQDVKESLIMTVHFKQILKNANMFDLKQLIRVDDQKVIISKMCIEILVENYDGNGFDASNIALLASVLDCKLDAEGKPHLKVDNYPISTTFCFRRPSTADEEEKSDEIVFQDPSLDDEKLSDGMLNVVINAGTNQLVLLNKTGGEGISLDRLKDCIKIATRRSSRLRNLLKSKQNKLV